MNGALQLIGFILNTVGYVCALVATAVPEWRRNDPSGEVLESIVRHQGIWVRCISYPTGQWQCDDYDAFFLGLPGPLQVARGLTVTACILGIIGFIVSLIGMRCTSCLDDNLTMKSRISLAGAICFALSGMAIGGAVSYYSYQVLSEYSRDIILYADDVGQRYIYGASLFVGWGSMAVTFIGSLVAGCGSCVGDEDEPRRPYMPTYKGHKANATEYV